MISIYNNKLNNIYIIADIHGRFTTLINEININPILNDCILICAGDIGVGFNSKEYYNNIFENLNNLFLSRNIHAYFIRGNHDDPEYFNGQIYYSNLKLVPDYSVIINNDKHILCIGGGISIDRVNRIAYDKIHLNFDSLYPSYWINEEPIFDENIINELTSLNININTIVTHTSPSFAYKNDKNGIEYWLSLDENLSKSIDNERLTMNNILYCLQKNGHNITKWIYGHFHGHVEETHDNIEYIALYNFDYMSDIFKLS